MIDSHRGEAPSIIDIDRFHSRDQQPCKFIVTKESFYIRKEFNSHRIGFTLQHGRRFIVFALNMAAVTSRENLKFVQLRRAVFVNKNKIVTESAESHVDRELNKRAEFTEING